MEADQDEGGGQGPERGGEGGAGKSGGDHGGQEHRAGGADDGELGGGQAE